MASQGRKSTKNAQRRPRAAKKVSEVGLFFVVGGKPWAEGVLWTENPSVSGFRTYGVDHSDFWSRLQDLGAAPKDVHLGTLPAGGCTTLTRPAASLSSPTVA